MGHFERTGSFPQRNPYMLKTFTFGAAPYICMEGQHLALRIDQCTVCFRSADVNFQYDHEYTSIWVRLDSGTRHQAQRPDEFCTDQWILMGFVNQFLTLL